MVRLREINKEEIKDIPFSEQQEVRITSCQIVQDKLISQINDGREISIDINLLIKQGVLNRDDKLEQLKSLELQNEGMCIYFPETDEILPAWIIIRGLSVSCWEDREIKDRVETKQEPREKRTNGKRPSLHLK